MPEREGGKEKPCGVYRMLDKGLSYPGSAVYISCGLVVRIGRLDRRGGAVSQEGDKWVGERKLSPLPVSASIGQHDVSLRND